MADLYPPVFTECNAHCKCSCSRAQSLKLLLAIQPLGGKRSLGPSGTKWGLSLSFFFLSLSLGLHIASGDIGVALLWSKCIVSWVEPVPSNFPDHVDCQIVSFMGARWHYKCFEFAGVMHLILYRRLWSSAMNRNLVFRVGRVQFAFTPHRRLPVFWLQIAAKICSFYHHHLNCLDSKPKYDFDFNCCSFFFFDENVNFWKQQK